jgi:hypothetical protein
VDAALDEPPMFVDMKLIGKRESFNPQRHKVFVLLCAQHTTCSCVCARQGSRDVMY